MPILYSTPELISMHQVPLLNALSTFLELIPPESIKFCFIFILSITVQSKASPVPPYKFGL
jgi:hypothetical protein